MNAELNRKSLAFGVPGIVLQTGCAFALSGLQHQAMAGGTSADPFVSLLLLAGSLLGLGLLVTGLCFYARAKGHSAALGVLGLLSCVGLLILALLPDRTKLVPPKL